MRFVILRLLPHLPPQPPMPRLESSSPNSLIKPVQPTCLKPAPLASLTPGFPLCTVPAASVPPWVGIFLLSMPVCLPRWETLFHNCRCAFLGGKIIFLMPVCLPGWETLSDDWHPCVLFILAHRATRKQKQNHKKNFLQLPLSKLSRLPFLDPVNDLKLPVVVTATFACDYYYLDCYCLINNKQCLLSLLPVVAAFT